MYLEGVRHDPAVQVFAKHRTYQEPVGTGIV